MRADRLLSLVLLLQARGRMTAKQLCEELEVSERTIYRDVEALSIAGIPVYTERGPGGGISLIDSYRMNLTGLSADEVRALFMLSIPAPLDELGLGQELRTAMLKLSAALPVTRRSDEQGVRQRIHLDWTPMFSAVEPVAHLHTIQQAVWMDRKIFYRFIPFSAPWVGPMEALVDPYGLVAKAGVWYLVCFMEGHVRVVRLSQILELHILDETFERPGDFVLSEVWKACCVEYETNRPSFPVRVRVAPELIPFLKSHFGESIEGDIRHSVPDEAGWQTLTLPFETFEMARNRILSFGRAIEVLEPRALRDSVIDFATQIVNFYAR